MASLTIWLTTNLTAVEESGKWQLALKHRGVWALRKFSVGPLPYVSRGLPASCTGLLRQYVGALFRVGNTELPGDTEGYLTTDDVHLTYHLRQSDNEWAQCVANRRPYRLLVEQHNFGPEPVDSELDLRLKAENIDYLRAAARCLSKYVRDARHGILLVPRSQSWDV